MGTTGGSFSLNLNLLDLFNKVFFFLWVFQAVRAKHRWFDMDFAVNIVIATSKNRETRRISENASQAKNGLRRCTLGEESSYQITFRAPWEKFRFLVLHFGLKCDPEEIQKSLEDNFKEVEKINPSVDDIELGSARFEKYCNILRRTLTKSIEANLNFN